MATILNLQTNISSLSAQRNIMMVEDSLSTAMTRLASGVRINRAGDDAAGLAISEMLRAHVRGLSQAQRNANDGVSMLQVAEGALSELSDMLIRMRELSVQSANGTFGSAERASLNGEFGALRSEIDRIASVTEFNGQKLIDGSLSGGITFQIGIQNTVNDRISVTLSSAVAASLGISTTQTISTVTAARQVISLMDTAIKAVTDRRGAIGGVQNRLVHTMNVIAVSRENLSAANSRIRDADIAEESANLARSQILMQAGTAMLAQANQLPQLALQLIGAR